MFWKTSVIMIMMLMLTGCNPFHFLYVKDAEKHSTSLITKASKRELPADFFPAEIDVVSLGDSLTQGIGDSSDQGGYIPYLVSYLEQNKGIKKADFTNYGIRGNRTTDLLARLNEPAIKEDLETADAIIITIGGNDIMKVVKDQFTNLTLKDFYVEGNNLSLQLYQRSADLFLGVPFNIASYALLLILVADVCHLHPKEFVHTLGVAHIYENHLEQVRLQLTRIPKKLPHLKLLHHHDDITKYQFDDIVLEDYDPYPPIKGKVAV